jgi:ABC-2 type transport system ATP-binding protein
MARIRIEPSLTSAVEFDHVSLALPKRKRRQGGGRRQRLRRLAGETRREDFAALTDASFTVLPGETVLVVGARSAHRRALLRLAAGTVLPDSGTVQRRFPWIPMIDLARTLGRGFTVRHNIYLLGGLLGMTPDQVSECVADIADTAGLASKLDRHLGQAPASVRQKLAWTTAMATNAQAFAIDEVLAVGEPAFRAQCFAHVADLRSRGVTFLVASDAPRQLEAEFDRALYIDEESGVHALGVDEGIERMRAARRALRSDEDPQDSEDDN